MIYNLMGSGWTFYDLSSSLSHCNGDCAVKQNVGHCLVPETNHTSPQNKFFSKLPHSSGNSNPQVIPIPSVGRYFLELHIARKEWNHALSVSRKNTRSEMTTSNVQFLHSLRSKHSCAFLGKGIARNPSRSASKRVLGRPIFHAGKAPKTLFFALYFHRNTCYAGCLFFDWKVPNKWSTITNFKILRELDRGYDDVTDSLV